MKLTQSKAMKQRRFAWFWPSIVAACAQQPLVVTSNNINTNTNKKLLLLLTNQQTPTCDHWWLFFSMSLFYINDIGSCLSEGTMLPLYADGTKCCRVINSQGDCMILQDDLFSIFNWIGTWSINFNLNKNIPKSGVKCCGRQILRVQKRTTYRVGERPHNWE